LRNFIYIFLLFVALGLTHKIGLIRHAHEFAKRDKEKSNYKEITNFDNINTKDYPFSNKSIPNKKKKKVKGTQPLLCLADEPTAITNVITTEHKNSYKKLYYYQLFFSDKKRGPPYI
jgi:hypothetical protein